MVTISDTYNLRNIGVNALRIADAIDALVLTVGNDTFTSTNTTSASLVDISGASFTIATVSGQSLFIEGHIALSCSAANTRVQIGFTVDGSAQPVHYWTNSVTGTGGNDESVICIAYIGAPSVGTHTIKMQWATAAGTLYTAGGQFWAIAPRTS